MLGSTARAFGEPMPGKYGGKDVLFCGRFVEVYPRVQAEFYRRHPNPMKVYREAVDAGLFSDPAERELFLRLCVEQADRARATHHAEILDWIGSIEGQPFYGSLVMKWPPKDGQDPRDAPNLTEEEVRELMHTEMEATYVRYLEQAEKADERVAWEEKIMRATDDALLKMHEQVNAASGSDLLGKETGQSSGGPEPTVH